MLESEEKSSLDELRKKILTERDEVFFDRVFDMLYAELYPVEEICNKVPLGQAAKTRIRAHSAIVDTRRNYTLADAPDHSFNQIKVLAKDLDRILKPKKSFPDRYSAEMHRRLTKSLAGDALFLGKISTEHDRGYTAVLRMIRELRQDRVSLTAVSERIKQNFYTARRMSRLSTLYTHRLVQQMSQVFTDIGLPVDYEAFRDSLIETRLSELLS
ncbi:hypothetical protein [Amycolatopsis sp. NPDC051716]|uniref:hypothetical protein n=1 Tax=Amycolatopsis sp. NPDC051716 TaxID=3155804 RepID=UPI003421D7D5